jgi:hypothetical protein
MPIHEGISLLVLYSAVNQGVHYEIQVGDVVAFSLELTPDNLDIPFDILEHLSNTTIDFLSNHILGVVAYPGVDPLAGLLTALNEPATFKLLENLVELSGVHLGLPPEVSLLHGGAGDERKQQALLSAQVHIPHPGVKLVLHKSLRIELRSHLFVDLLPVFHVLAAQRLLFEIHQPVLHNLLLLPNRPSVHC